MAYEENIWGKYTYDSNKTQDENVKLAKAADALITQAKLENIEEGIKNVEATPGPKGEPGKKGEPGTDGKDGGKGNPGAKGEPGTAGEDGAKGDTGDTGKAGPKGAPGKDAEDVGTAALETDAKTIKEAINELYALVNAE